MSALQRFRETFWTPQAALYFAVVGVSLPAALVAVEAVQLNRGFSVLVGLLLATGWQALSEWLGEIQAAEQD